MSAGVIDNDDYLFWQQNFGRVGGSGSETVATEPVPEPSTAKLLIAALVIGIRFVLGMRRVADVASRLRVIPIVLSVHGWIPGVRL